MSCLPGAGEWSEATRLALIADHLEALRAHIQALEAALSEGPQGLLDARHHWQEICQRGVEGNELSITFLPRER
jgi:hypothetical protein